MKWSLLGTSLFFSTLASAQAMSSLQNPSDSPVDPNPWRQEQNLVARGYPQVAQPQVVPSAPVPDQLSLRGAESLALKNNPRISAARLNALAQHQVTRETRSNLWPTANADLTAVDAHTDSRITAGALNNPIIYERAAYGATVSQLITDFGHTTNLVASAHLREKAEDQTALATQQDILLAIDQAFYGVLQARAVLRVAQETVKSRQLLSDQVTALTKSKLKSDLDLSFANVNLAQAKLLELDADNNAKSALATLSALLAVPLQDSAVLVEHEEEVKSPPANLDMLVADALRQRPEILAQEFQTQSEQKLHQADRDQFYPTISALGAVGEAPIRNDHLSSWYGAIGVNVQIPVFNGFLYPAKSRESELRARAANENLIDLKNRIARDVRTSWLNATTAYSRLSVTQQLLDQSNLALNLAQTRYNLGLGSIVELSQAQLQQTQAEISNAQAGYDYRLALAILKYQTGG
jgi:outer membrane protein